MPKYKGAYKSTLQEDNKTYSEELAEEQAKNAEPQEAEPANAEEASFKKRYGDIRRHLQSVSAQKDQEITNLKAQLDNATRSQIKFPKTDAEIEKWSQKYPDVAKIVDTIARKRANEALEVGEKKLAEVQKLQGQIKKEKAEKQLLSLHPDFAEIRQQQSFHEWASLQPQWVQDALYKNSTDAVSAGRAIDLYKMDLARAKKQKNNGAAESVRPTRGTKPPVSQGSSKFTESQVEAMSPQEYEKYEDAIMDSVRNGTFVYDIQGAAR